MAYDPMACVSATTPSLSLCTLQCDIFMYFAHTQQLIVFPVYGVHVLLPFACCSISNIPARRRFRIYSALRSFVMACPERNASP